jgi:DNA-binding LytR/AlgR family response regulator
MKNLINAFIIEDEQPHAEIIKESMLIFSKNSLLIEFDVHLIKDYLYFYENLNTFSFLNTDVFIIDIHLHSTFTGIQVAQKIRALNTKATIIFITGDASKGIEIINNRIYPLSYIVKQSTSNLFFQEEIYSLLKKIEQNITTNEANSLTVYSGSTKRLFHFSEIYYIASVKSQKNKVEIKTQQQQIICKGKISELKRKLNAPYLYTELNSLIINFDHIQSYNQKEQTLTFSDQTELLLGAKMIQKFSHAFLSYVKRSSV